MGSEAGNVNQANRPDKLTHTLDEIPEAARHLGQTVTASSHAAVRVFEGPSWTSQPARPSPLRNHVPSPNVQLKLEKVREEQSNLVETVDENHGD